MVFRGRISIRGKGRGKRGRGQNVGEQRETFKPGNAPKTEPVFRMAITGTNFDEAPSKQPWPPSLSNYEDDKDITKFNKYGKSSSPPRIYPNDRRSPERSNERSSRGSHSSSLSKSHYDYYKGRRSRDKSRSPERKRRRSRSRSRSRSRQESRSRHRSRSRNRSRSRSRRSRSSDRRRSTSRNRDRSRLRAVSRSRSPSNVSSSSDREIRVPVDRKIPVTSDLSLVNEENASNRRGLFPLSTESLRITVGNERYAERSEFPTVSEDVLQDAIEIVKDYQSAVKDYGRRQETSDSHIDSFGKEISLDTFRSHSLEKKFSPNYSSPHSSHDDIESSKMHHYDRKSPSPIRKRELNDKRDNAYQRHKSSSSRSRQNSSPLKSILKQKEEMTFFSKSGAVTIPGLDDVNDIDDEEAFLYGEESKSISSSNKTKERKMDKNDSVKKTSNFTDSRLSSTQSKTSHSMHSPSLDIIQSKSEAAKKELANILQVIGFGVPQDAIERIKLKAESMDETMRLQEARMMELKNKDYKTKDSKEVPFELSEQNSSFHDGSLSLSSLNQRVSAAETNWPQIPANPSVQSRQDSSYPEYPPVPMQHSEYPKVQSHNSDFPQVKTDHPEFSQNQNPFYWSRNSLPTPNYSNYSYPPPQPPYGPPSLHHMPGPLPPHYGYDKLLNEEVQPSRSNLRIIPIQNSSKSTQELIAKSNFKTLVKENKISHSDPPPIKKIESVKEIKPILKKNSFDEVKKEIKSEPPKEIAQKFASREEYLSMLVNKQTDYSVLISNLNKEIDHLRKQQGELMRKNRKQKDGHKDPLLLENTLLQDEITRKVKDITQHLDDVKVAIKDINTNQSNFRSALTIRRILSEVALKKDKDKQEKTDETVYEYFDSGNHWCRNCNEKAASMFEMLDHIQSQQHKQTLDPYLRPWRKEASKTTTSSRPKSNVFVAPIKGVEFLIPATSFYCQLCHEFSGDSNSALDHLKTSEHHKKYLKYIEENQFYERRLNLEKAVGLILRKEKLKRKNEDAGELERRAKEQKKNDITKDKDQSKSESWEDSTSLMNPETNNLEIKKHERNRLETKISEPKSPETKKTEIENEAEIDDTSGFGKFSWKKDDCPTNEVSALENEGNDAKSIKSKIAIKLTGKTVIPPTSATPWQPVMKRLLVNKPVLIKKGPMFPLRKPKVERQDKPVPLDVFINLKLGTGQAAKVDSAQTMISQEDISAAFSGKEVDTEHIVSIPQDITSDQSVVATISEKLNIEANSEKEANFVDQQKASGPHNILQEKTNKQIVEAEIVPIIAEKVTTEPAVIIPPNVSSNDPFVFKIPNQPDINYKSKVGKETKPVPANIQTSFSNKVNINEPLVSSSQNSLSKQIMSPQKSIVISLPNNPEIHDKESISDQNTKTESLPIVTISNISSAPQLTESSIVSLNVSAGEVAILGPHLPENINEKDIKKFKTENLPVEIEQSLEAARNKQNNINTFEIPTSTTEILVAPQNVLKEENQICTPCESIEQTEKIGISRFEPNLEKMEVNESSNILTVNILQDVMLQTEENKQVQETICNFTSLDKTNIYFQSNQIVQDLMSPNVSTSLEMIKNQTGHEVSNVEESTLETSSIDVPKYEKSDGKTPESIEQTEKVRISIFDPKPEKMEVDESSNILSVNILQDIMLQTEENKQVKETVCNFTSADKTSNIDFRSTNVSTCLEMKNQTDHEVSNLEESVLKTSSNDLPKYEKSDGKTSEVIVVNIPYENVEMIESANQKIGIKTYENNSEIDLPLKPSNAEKEDISFTNLVTSQIEGMEILIEGNQGDNSCQLKVDPKTSSSNEMIIDSTETNSVLHEISKEFGAIVEKDATITEEKQIDCLSIESGISNLENESTRDVSLISIADVHNVSLKNEDVRNIPLPGENISVSDQETDMSTVFIADSEENKLKKLSPSDIKKNQQSVENISEKEFKIKSSINQEVIEEIQVQTIQNMKPSVSGFEPFHSLDTECKEKLESESKELSKKVITKIKSCHVKKEKVLNEIDSISNLIEVSESIVKPVSGKKKRTSEEKHRVLKEVRIIVERCDQPKKTISLKSSNDKISKVTTAVKIFKTDGKMDENYEKIERKTQAKDEKLEAKSGNKHKKKKGKEINELKDKYLDKKVNDESKAKIIMDEHKNKVENEKSEVQKIDYEMSTSPVDPEQENIIENKISENFENKLVDKKISCEVSESKTYEYEKSEREKIEFEEKMDYETTEVQVKNKVSDNTKNKQDIKISPEVIETKTAKDELEKSKEEKVGNEFEDKIDYQTTEIPVENKHGNVVELKISEAQMENEYKTKTLEGKQENKTEHEQVGNEYKINYEIIETQSEHEYSNKVENERSKKLENKVEVSHDKTIEVEQENKVESEKSEVQKIDYEMSTSPVDQEYKNIIEIKISEKTENKLVDKKISCEGSESKTDEYEKSEREQIENEFEEKMDYETTEVQVEKISDKVKNKQDIRISPEVSETKTINGELEKLKEEKAGNEFEDKIDYQTTEISVENKHGNVELLISDAQTENEYKAKIVEVIHENKTEREQVGNEYESKINYEIIDAQSEHECSNKGENESKILENKVEVSHDKTVEVEHESKVENEKSEIQKIDYEINTSAVDQEHKNIIEIKISEKIEYKYMDKKITCEVSESKTDECEYEKLEREKVGNEFEEKMDYETTEVQVENKISDKTENKQEIKISLELDETKTVKGEHENSKEDNFGNKFKDKIDYETTEITVENEHVKSVELKISEAQTENECKAKTVEDKCENKAESEQVGNEFESKINYEIIAQSEHECGNKVENESKKSENEVNHDKIVEVEHESIVESENMENLYKVKKIENEIRETHDDENRNRVENEKNKSEIENGNRKISEIIVAKTIEGNVESEVNEVKPEYERKIEYEVNFAKRNDLECQNKEESEQLENEYENKIICGVKETNEGNAGNKIEVSRDKNIEVRVAETIEGKYECKVENVKIKHDEQIDCEMSEALVLDDHGTKENINEVKSGYKDKKNKVSDAKTIENASENKVENEKSKVYYDKMDYEISEIPIKDETKRIEIKVDSAYKDKNNYEVNESKEVEENQITQEISVVNKMHNEISDTKKDDANEINDNILKDESEAENKSEVYFNQIEDKIPIRDANKNNAETERSKVEINFDDNAKSKEIEENQEMGRSVLTKVEENENKISEPKNVEDDKNRLEYGTSKLKIEDKFENLKMDYKISAATKIENVKTMENENNEIKLVEYEDEDEEMEYEISKSTIVKDSEDKMDIVDPKFEYENRTDSGINFENTSEIKKVEEYEDKVENEKIDGIVNETSLPESNPSENPANKGNTLDTVVERYNEKPQILDKKGTEIETNFELVGMETTETDNAEDVSLKLPQIQSIERCEQKPDKYSVESSSMTIQIENQVSVNIKVVVPEQQMSTIEATSILECSNRMAEIDNNISCTDTKTEVELHTNFSEISGKTERDPISAIPSSSSKELSKLETRKESNSDGQLFNVLEVLTKMCEETASNPVRLESTSFTTEPDKTSSTYSLVDSTEYLNVDSSTDQTSDLLVPVNINQFEGTDESKVNDSMNEASNKCQHMPSDKDKDIEEKK